MPPRPPPPVPVRPLLATVVVLLALAAFLPAARAAAPGRERSDDRDWFKMVSPNFELYGNGRESQARRLLGELETFRYVVSRFLGLTNVQRRPALVFLFKDDSSFRGYKPRYNGQPSIVSGFHVEDPMDQILALGRQDRDAATMRVLFHEYTHLLTARAFRHAPAWAHEGVAEVFSTFEGDPPRFDIGVAVTNHALLLQRQDPLPTTKLLAVTRDSPDYNEQARAGPFYASSWLLAHYLLFARRGFESNVVARYAALCAGTTNQLDAFRSAFQSNPESFDPLLREYVRGGRYTVVRQTFPDFDEARSRGQRRDLGPGELDYALGRLLQMTRQTEPALARLRRAAELAPRDPRPLEALALEAWRTQDRGTLRSASDAALALGSQDAFLHFLAAELRYREAARPDPSAPPSRDSLDAGRRLCRRALELDPWLAPAHHLLGIFILAENPRAPALAAVHVQQALRCDPNYQPALITWASLLAAQGNIGTARLILARVLASPLPPELREAARRIADDLDRRAGSLPPRNPSR